MVNFKQLAADATARRLAAENPDVVPSVSNESVVPPVASVPPAEAEPAGNDSSIQPSVPRRFGVGNGNKAGAGTADGEAAGTSDGPVSTNRIGIAALKLPSASAGTPSESGDSGGMAASLGLSLDALDGSTDPGVVARPSGFSDETPATRPTRTLPEGIDKESLQFIDMIDGVYEVIHEPDMMGGVIRNIIMELKSHPEYMKLVAPEDIRTWVRGMRESMGLAKIKKVEAKAKRSGGAGRKSKLVDNDMLADLESLGISLGD